MIKGIGVDISDIERFEDKINDENFTTRIFTQEEISYFKKKKNSAESAAGFFSAKEAFIKALGFGMFHIPFCEIGVSHMESGAPALKLQGKAKEIAGDIRLHLSISHSDKSAVAVVIAEE